MVFWFNSLCAYLSNIPAPEPPPAALVVKVLLLSLLGHLVVAGGDVVTACEHKLLGKGIFLVEDL